MLSCMTGESGHGVPVPERWLEISVNAKAPLLKGL